MVDGGAQWIGGASWSEMGTELASLISFERFFLQDGS